MRSLYWSDKINCFDFFFSSFFVKEIKCDRSASKPASLSVCLGHTGASGFHIFLWLSLPSEPPRAQEKQPLGDLPTKYTRENQHKDRHGWERGEETWQRGKARASASKGRPPALNDLFTDRTAWTKSAKEVYAGRRGMSGGLDRIIL